MFHIKRGMLALSVLAVFAIQIRPTLADPAGVPPGLKLAMEVQDAHTAELMLDPEVVGTAVGLNAEGEPVIVVFLASERKRVIPLSFEGFSVDVRVTGRIFALDGGADPKARFPRPVHIGISTGHPDITAGTIGARVTDGTDVYALSNNHVYANQNDAAIGDAVIQPGDFDGGTSPADDIGNLFDFEPILFDGSDNIMDAAIALSSTLLLGNATPEEGGYGTPNSTTVAASLNQAVQKYGRTTKLTAGTISEINVTVNVCYEPQGPFFCKRNKLARFVDQIAIEGAPDPGDFSAGGTFPPAVIQDPS